MFASERTVRAQAVLAVALVFGASNSAANGPDLTHGHPDCPCVDLVAAGVYMHDTSVPSVLSAATGCPPNTMQRQTEADKTCYPLAYGSKSCVNQDRIHDTEECRATPAPRWCNDPWCWVDPVNCKFKMHNPNLYFPGLSTGASVDNTTGLHYSYGTCGHLDHYTEDSANHPFQLKIKNDMKGGKLRIAFPSTTWSPDLLNVAGFEHLNPASNTGTGLTLSSNDIGKEGAFVEYFGDILKDYGINTFHVVGITNESKAFSTSTFTQCCHEIALNNADICVGPFWPTDARMYSFLSHGLRFSSAVYEDEFKMVQNKVENQGLSSAWPLLVWTMGLESDSEQVDEYSNMMQNLYVWISIISMLVFSGIVMFIIEGHTNAESFAGTSAYENLAEGVFNSLQAFVGMGDHRHVPHTHAGRLLIITTSLSIIVLVSTYTAKITFGMLKVQGSGGNYASIAEAIQNNAKVCGLSSMETMFMAKFPGSAYVKYDEAYDCLDALVLDKNLVENDGKWCDITIVTVIEFEQLQDAGRYCDKVMSKETIYTFSEVYAVRQEVYSMFNWALTKSNFAGKFAPIQKKWKTQLRSAASCVGVVEDKTVGTGDKAFDLVAFAVYSSVGFSCFILVAFGFIDWWTHRQAKKKNERAKRAHPMDGDLMNEFELTTPSLYDRFFKPIFHTIKPDLGSDPSHPNTLAGRIQLPVGADRNDLLLVDGMLKSRTTLMRKAGQNLSVDIPLTLADMPLLIALIRGEDNNKHPLLPKPKRFKNLAYRVARMSSLGTGLAKTRMSGKAASKWKANTTNANTSLNSVNETAEETFSGFPATEPKPADNIYAAEHQPPQQQQQQGGAVTKEIKGWI